MLILINMLPAQSLAKVFFSNLNYIITAFSLIVVASIRCKIFSSGVVGSIVVYSGGLGRGGTVNTFSDLIIAMKAWALAII